MIQPSSKRGMRTYLAIHWGCGTVGWLRTSDLILYSWNVKQYGQRHRVVHTVWKEKAYALLKQEMYPRILNYSNFWVFFPSAYYSVPCSFKEIMVTSHRNHEIDCQCPTNRTLTRISTVNLHPLHPPASAGSVTVNRGSTQEPPDANACSGTKPQQIRRAHCVYFFKKILNHPTGGNSKMGCHLKLQDISGK